MKGQSRTRPGPVKPLRKQDYKKAVAMLKTEQRKQWDKLTSKQKINYINHVQESLEQGGNFARRGYSNSRNYIPVSKESKIPIRNTSYNVRKRQKLIERKYGISKAKEYLEDRTFQNPPISRSHEFNRREEINLKTSGGNRVPTHKYVKKEIGKKRKNLRKQQNLVALKYRKQKVSTPHIEKATFRESPQESIFIDSRESVLNEKRTADWKSRTRKKYIEKSGQTGGVLGTAQVEKKERKNHYVRNAADIATVLSVHMDKLIQKENKKGEQEERKQYMKSIFVEKIQMKTMSIAKQAGTKAGAALLHMIGKIVAAVVSFFMPILAVFGIVMVFLCIIVSLFSFLFGASSSSGGYIGKAQVNEQCERYRPLVVKYCEKYDMEEFVEIVMCIMMQESGGNSEQYPDIMQSSEYAGLPVNTLGIEESVDYGVQAIRDAMQVAGCTSPSELDKLKLALQGYNYGSGYVSWAMTNYGGYSKENAILFSNIMAAKMGWARYGDTEYVDHVLQYYIFSGGYSPDGISNQEAVEQLGRLSAGWPTMDERRGAVIAKGASLIGYTTYDMFGEDTRAGVDLPRTLDCSSFVAWAFQKSGFIDVPYGSTTGTFVNSQNFTPIGAADLIPGDIGLMNTIPAGGNNHVGFYVGTDENGAKMFLHCTSHPCSGSSIVDGPRISYYSSFQIFYRYTGFS